MIVSGAEEPMLVGEAGEGDERSPASCNVARKVAGVCEMILCRCLQKEAWHLVGTA